MLVVAKSEITLGNVRFYGGNTGVNSVTIKQSVDNFGTTALKGGHITGRIPRTIQNTTLQILQKPNTIPTRNIFSITPLKSTNMITG